MHLGPRFRIDDFHLLPVLNGLELEQTKNEGLQRIEQYSRTSLSPRFDKGAVELMRNSACSLQWR